MNKLFAIMTFAALFASVLGCSDKKSAGGDAGVTDTETGTDTATETGTETGTDTATGTDTDTGTGAQAEAGLSVSNSDVRSCDILLTEQASKVVSVTFADTVEGEFGRWAPKVAISFTKKNDEASTGQLATLSVEEGAGPSDHFVTASVECFDRAGKKVDEPGLTIQID